MRDTDGCPEYIEIRETQNMLPDSALFGRGNVYRVRCDVVDPHSVHSAPVELKPIDGRRPNAVQTTVLRMMW